MAPRPQTVHRVDIPDAMRTECGRKVSATPWETRTQIALSWANVTCGSCCRGYQKRMKKSKSPWRKYSTWT